MESPLSVDYLLRYTRDFALAVVEGKAEYKSATDAVQQARDYAEILGLKFAYATNGIQTIEIDFFTGTEKRVADFPKPEELWRRYQAGSGIDTPERLHHLIARYNTVGGKPPRYYQQIAINRAVEFILAGKKRLLLTMATGTGKTIVAFQISWKLWSSGWNRTGEHRKPRILFLADRNILIDDPKDKTFAPFGDARHKIESGEICEAAYALSPNFIPILGQVDDLLIVPAGIFLAVKLLPREIMAEYRAAAFDAEQQPSSRAAAAVIISIWITVAALLIWGFWPTAVR